MFLSFFSNYTHKQPADKTLDEVAQLIRCDARIQTLTETYRLTHEKKVKESCPLFGVAARFQSGKKKGDIVQLTGLGLVDIDHIEQANSDTLQALKQKACDDPHTLLCYITVSGQGLRIIFRYNLDTSVPLIHQMQYYPRAFAAGNAYYSHLLGVTTDSQVKNVGRLSGLAHDAEVYIHEDATPFTTEDVAQWAEPEVQRQWQMRDMRRERLRLERCYESLLRQEVEADGAEYAPGRHNDYVMRVGYKLNQMGFDREVAVAWATKQFADYPEAADVIQACYARTEEFGTRSRHRRHEKTDDTMHYATVQEIQDFLRERVQLRYNVITRRVEVDGAPITDRLVNSLWTEMSATQRVNVQDIYRVIESDFVPDFHPFREYLEALRMKKEPLTMENEALQPSPIHLLAQSVTVRGGEAEQQRFEHYLRKWLVGMVAAWLDADVVNNVILVLIGEQGTYKTTWFSYLLPPQLRRYFYTKTNAMRMGRDDLLTLAQYALVCCEELDTMRPSELNQLKAAVTMTSIDERAAYAHFHEHRPHIASFCATGNNIQFLSDPTGNRRWLPFEVEHILSPREHPFDYEGIYAEAYRLYLEGFRFWFSREEVIELSTYNRHFETPRLEVELVQQHFRVPAEGEYGEFMPVSLALQIVSANISQKLSAVNMGRAFRELGFEQRRIKEIRGYLVVRYTAAEMEQRRKLGATL